jgi:aspartyl-tRNA(Asn)/glutamyl-tRNA(Gln) amidotransferase subunit A
MLGSFLDMPGVSLPVGADAGGLPIGLLLSACRGEDDRLLAAALAVEAVVQAR